MHDLQMWGGLEAPLQELKILDHLAELGVRRIHYPCHWDVNAPNGTDWAQWRPLDRALARMQKLNLSPIAEFLRHSSGPTYTSFLDPEFPEKFASYARAFTRRFPWVDYYAPIQEIQKTVQTKGFSDLYFLKAILYQCQATVMAMREIRRINSHAKFIQIEDVGIIQSPPSMAHEREFKNHCRWLVFDLLCGDVGVGHPLYEYLLETGISEKEIHWFQENTCTPDILGINHSSESNRFLEASEGRAVTPPQPEKILQETWKRYHLPMALTKGKIEGHGEEQIKLIQCNFEAAKSGEKQGLSVKAITINHILLGERNVIKRYFNALGANS